MKNDTITRLTTRALELEDLQPSSSYQTGIGAEPTTLMEEIGDRPLIAELAVFANAIWV